VAEGHASEWRRVVDTARPSPDDIVEPGNEQLETTSYLVGARSVVVLRRDRRERQARISPGATK
jgi:glycogen operon protein